MINTDIELPHPDDVVMLDLEASSMRGANGGNRKPEALSYPIEAGVAHADGRVETKLIKPQPDWTDWSGEPDNPDIGRFHGIARSELFEKGEDVSEVARWLNEELTGKIVMCDSPQARPDTFWVNRLFSAAGIQREFDVHFLYDYMDLDDPDTYLAYDNTGLEREAQHRAGQDAEDLMTLYREYCVLKSEDHADDIDHDNTDDFVP